jgi:predicted nucleic acid-binding protein
MLFDTDIFIWVQRGNARAAARINAAQERYVSIQTYMELLQSTANKKQHQYTKSFLIDLEFTILPLTENIGHRAAVYIEEYSLSSGLRAGDAIIAATAVENNIPLMTSNIKHFKPINELILKGFQP